MQLCRYRVASTAGHLPPPIRHKPSWHPCASWHPCHNTTAHLPNNGKHRPCQQPPPTPVHVLSHQTQPAPYLDTLPCPAPRPALQRLILWTSITAAICTQHTKSEPMGAPPHKQATVASPCPPLATAHNHTTRPRPASSSCDPSCLAHQLQCQALTRADLSPVALAEQSPQLCLPVLPCTGHR